MRVCLECRSVRSMRWAVKKVLALTKMMYNKSGVIVVILKSFFLSEEQKRRISRGYCRNDRPSSIYWVGGLVRGHLVVRGQINAIMEVSISE